MILFMINNPFINVTDIQQKAKEIRTTGETLDRQLSLMTQDIKYIFSCIKDCKSIEEASPYFTLLDIMQSVLAELVFKYEIGVPDKLRRFLCDFDNLDHYGDHYFKKIKNGEYVF